MAIAKDITGNIYAELTVIERAGSLKGEGSTWKCKCSCGGYKVVSARNLRNGTTKSCGCLRKRNLHANYNENSGIIKAYHIYRSNAKTRGLDFNISFDEFIPLVKDNCHYCGCESSNGIDRKNPNLGYDMDNVVSCCKKCNNLKRKKQYDEFMSLPKRGANLTVDLMDTIKQMYHNGKKQLELAKEFGLSQSRISLIVNNKL